MPWSQPLMTLPAPMMKPNGALDQVLFGASEAGDAFAFGRLATLLPQGRYRLAAPDAGDANRGFAESIEGGSRLPFGHEADHGVEHDHDPNRRRLQVISHHQRQDRGADQESHDEALELPEENLPRADALAFLQFIRATCLHSFFSFLNRKTGGR